MKLIDLKNNEKISLIKTIVCKYIKRFTYYRSGLYSFESYPYENKEKIVEIISEYAHDYSPKINKEVYNADDILLEYEKQIIDELKHHLSDFSYEDKEFFSSFLSDYESQEEI